MEYKNLINGKKIPSIGLGTWLMGGDTNADYSKDKETIAIIKKAIEIGYTLIDTAEMYGNGHCEELIGRAIVDSNREDLFLVSKVLNTHLQYDKVIQACKNSLKRLDTDYLDMYLIHAPNREVPLEETIKAMNVLAKEGLVKTIGVSMFSLELLKKAQTLSDAPIVAHQIEYSILARNKGRYGEVTNMEKELVPYHQKEGIITMAVRPVERGLLINNIIVKQIAEKYNKSPAQVAINWLIIKEGIVAIPKASKEEHLKDNLGALGWKIKSADLKILDSIKEIDNFPKV